MAKGVVCSIAISPEQLAFVTDPEKYPELIRQALGPPEPHTIAHRLYMLLMYHAMKDGLEQQMSGSMDAVAEALKVLSQQQQAVMQMLQSAPQPRRLALARNPGESPAPAAAPPPRPAGITQENIEGWFSEAAGILGPDPRGPAALRKAMEWYLKQCESSGEATSHPVRAIVDRARKYMGIDVNAIDMESPGPPPPGPDEDS